MTFSGSRQLPGKNVGGFRGVLGGTLGSVFGIGAVHIRRCVMNFVGGRHVLSRKGLWYAESDFCYFILMFVGCVITSMEVDTS